MTLGIVGVKLSREIELHIRRFLPNIGGIWFHEDLKISSYSALLSQIE